MPSTQTSELSSDVERGETWCAPGRADPDEQAGLLGERRVLRRQHLAEGLLERRQVLRRLAQHGPRQLGVKEAEGVQVEGEARLAVLEHRVHCAREEEERHTRQEGGAGRPRVSE